MLMNKNNYYYKHIYDFRIEKFLYADSKILYSVIPRYESRQGVSTRRLTAAGHQF